MARPADEVLSGMLMDSRHEMSVDDVINQHNILLKLENNGIPP